MLSLSLCRYLSRTNVRNREPLRNHGFTLAEMLVVIAVIGILTAIAVPAYLGYRNKAARTEAVSSLDSIRMLEESYYAENGCYYRVGANCTNTTVTGVANIQAILPGFNPGNPNSLLFNYNLTITNTTAGNAQAFTMTATGKPGSPVEGSVFTIDQDNNRNF